MGDLTFDLETSEFTEKGKKLLEKLEDFDIFIQNNAQLILNHGERWRYGETISTAFAESTINQVVSKRMAKKQQMRWSQRCAHLLLQVRTRVLNDEFREHSDIGIRFLPRKRNIKNSRHSSPGFFRSRILRAFQ